MELVVSAQLVKPAPNSEPTLTKDEKVAPEVVVKEPPIPVLPEVVNVVPLIVVAFNPARLDSPVTFKPFNAPYPVILPPTPMLPAVLIL